MFCGKVAWALLGALAPCLAADKVQIVLDNADATVEKTVVKFYEGHFRVCMKDAYQGQIHHDWAVNKGDAHFSMKFKVPQDGCYMVEEYHPGSEEKCAKYLPRNAQLDVGYCKGLQKKFFVNQAVKGGQWNKLDALMFFKDRPGMLSLSGSLNETCDAGSCFLVADAFRLTLLGDDCDKAKALEPLAKGFLRLGVRYNKATGEAELDAAMQLRRHDGKIETALEAHFGYDRVEVNGIQLIGGRRLAAGPLQHFQVYFEAYGNKQVVMEDLNALRAALAAKLAGTGLEVATVGITWTMEDDSNMNAAASAAVIASCTCVMCTIVALLFALRQRCFRKATTSEEHPNANVVMGKLGSDASDEKPAKEDCKADVASNSTGEPADQQSEVGSSAVGDMGMRAASTLAFEDVAQSNPDEEVLCTAVV